MIEKIGWSGAMNLNNFHKQLKHSESSAGLILVSGTINMLYPDNNWVQEITDLKYQKQGLDRIVYLNTGDVVGVEHKIRETVYTDILLEFISNDKTNTKGWMEKDLICDLFIYGWNPLQKTYTFCWPELKKLWELNKKEWLSKYRIIKAKNYGYYTHSVAIPINIIKSKINYFVYSQNVR